MIIQEKRYYTLRIDEDEAEELIYDATPLQEKLRTALKGSNGHTAQFASPLELAPVKSGRGKRIAQRSGTESSAKRSSEAKLPKAAGKGRRPQKKMPCPECGKKMPPGWLVRHRQKEHGAALTVELDSPASTGTTRFDDDAPFAEPEN